MAFICPDSCVAPDIEDYLPQLGCAPIFRNTAFARILFIHCSVDTTELIPAGANTPALAFPFLAAAWAAGVTPTAFVSPVGNQTGYEQEDDTEIQYSQCGDIAFVDGALVVTMQFKAGWNTAAAAPTAPGLNQYGEDEFFRLLNKNPTGWNFGFVNCASELGYFLTQDETTFAKGSVSVKKLTEEVNQCNTIQAYEVKLTFKCGAIDKRIFTLNNSGFDDLIAWKP